jgi:hypothetical protein
MRYSYDTNVFVNSLINIKFRKYVDKFFNSKSSFLPRSLLKELNLITHISSYISKVGQLIKDNNLTLLEAIDHPRLKKYKRRYSNVYSYLKFCYYKKIDINQIESAMVNKVNNLLSSIQWLSSIASRNFIYPRDEDSFIKIISDEYVQRKKNELSLDDEDDIIHCVLCEALGKFEEKDTIYFISDDNHITSATNKEKIESTMEFLKVDTFQDHLSYYESLIS